MRCYICEVDLGVQETVTAIEGTIICNRCAMTTRTEQELYELAEQVVPSDIGIRPECDDCREEFDMIELNMVGDQKLCGTCIQKLLK